MLEESKDEKKEVVAAPDWPELPDWLHDVISHGWPLVLLLLILVAGRSFFEKRRKVKLLVVLCFIPLLVWGPWFFKKMDSTWGKKDGKIYTYFSNDFREFTSMEGKRIRASIIDVTEEKKLVEGEKERVIKVTIRRDDGKIYESAISRYSPKDQQFIRDWKSKQ